MDIQVALDQRWLQKPAEQTVRYCYRSSRIPIRKDIVTRLVDDELGDDEMDSCVFLIERGSRKLWAWGAIVPNAPSRVNESKIVKAPSHYLYVPMRFRFLSGTFSDPKPLVMPFRPSGQSSFCSLSPSDTVRYLEFISEARRTRDPLFLKRLRDRFSKALKLTVCEAIEDSPSLSAFWRRDFGIQGETGDWVEVEEQLPAKEQYKGEGLPRREISDEEVSVEFRMEGDRLELTENPKDAALGTLLRFFSLYGVGLPRSLLKVSTITQKLEFQDRNLKLDLSPITEETRSQERTEELDFVELFNATFQIREELETARNAISKSIAWLKGET